MSENAFDTRTLTVAQTDAQPFMMSDRITEKDGWLSPDGRFWSCAPDQHGACATHVRTQLEKEKDEKEPIATVDNEVPSRQTLFILGFVQLSHGYVVPPLKAVTRDQIARLDDGKYKIPVRLTDATLVERFTGLLQELSDERLDNTTRDLVRLFFDTELKFRIDDNQEQAEILFNALTTGFTREKRETVSQGYKREITLRSPDGGDFAVELIHHTHDSQTEPRVTSFVDVIPIKPSEMEEIQITQRRKFHKSEGSSSNAKYLEKKRQVLSKIAQIFGREYADSVLPIMNMMDSLRDLEIQIKTALGLSKSIDLLRSFRGADKLKELAKDYENALSRHPTEQAQIQNSLSFLLKSRLLNNWITIMYFHDVAADTGVQFEIPESVRKFIVQVESELSPQLEKEIVQALGLEGSAVYQSLRQLPRRFHWLRHTSDSAGFDIEKTVRGQAGNIALTYSGRAEKLRFVPQRDGYFQSRALSHRKRFQPQIDGPEMMAEMKIEEGWFSDPGVKMPFVSEFTLASQGHLLFFTFDKRSNLEEIRVPTHLLEDIDGLKGNISMGPDDTIVPLARFSDEIRHRIVDRLDGYLRITYGFTVGAIMEWAKASPLNASFAFDRSNVDQNSSHIDQQLSGSIALPALVELSSL